ncbi:TetR/AcrR family transcriptional regulator [Rhodococcus sp. NPDC060086]|uniref:TetR/AcrR family transcriptional regulator n=1 Tax=Rhodococcus sp. NPDC060086 TaxID=3347055 RepID=UPI00365931CC
MSNSEGARLPPEERRFQILDVAAEHFARHGYESASMSRIAADAGITRALVYHYFPNKETLLDAVLRREGQTLLEATAPQGGTSVSDALGRALKAYFSHFASSAGDLRDLYAPTAVSPSVVWEIAASNHEVQVERLIAATGQKDSPSTRLAFSAWLAFVETAARGAAQSGGVDTDEVLRLCLTVFEASTGLDPAALDAEVTTTHPNQEQI